MFGTLNFGIRAFFVGFALGILVAPRPGRETRRLVRRRFDELVDGLMEILALPEEPVMIPDRPRPVRADAAQSG
jgi:hypothetical protein